MTSDIHVGDYVFQVREQGEVSIIDTKKGTHTALGVSGAAVTALVAEVERLRGPPSVRGDVFDRLRLAFLSEAQLQAALMKIAQACGFGPGHPGGMSSEAIAEKAIRLIRAGKMADAAEDTVDEMRTRNAARVAELEAHLRDRDEACEKWAAKVESLEKERTTLLQQMRKEDEHVKSMNMDELTVSYRERIKLEARVKQLEAEASEVTKDFVKKIKRIGELHIENKALQARVELLERMQTEKKTSEAELAAAVKEVVEKTAIVVKPPDAPSAKRAPEPWAYAPDVEMAMHEAPLACSELRHVPDYVKKQITVALRAAGIIY